MSVETTLLESVKRLVDEEIDPIANERYHAGLNPDALYAALEDLGLDAALKKLGFDKTDLSKYAYLPAEVPSGIIETMGELGLFGLTIPEEYGGAGQGYATMAKVTEILSGAWLAVGSIATRNQITSTAILNHGTDRQREEWLPRLTSGEMMTAIAVTEPDYGSDIGNLQCRAERDGNHFVLNGQKMWCTYAHRANYLTTLARTSDEGRKGLTLFLVEKPSGDVLEGQGISGTYIRTDSYHGIPSFSLFFDNCRVPLENVVGEEEGLGKGFYATLNGFQEGRLQTAARAVGVAQRAYDLAFQYAKDRKQFGQPIIEFQAIQHQLAEMYTDLQAAKTLTYRACEAMDEDPEQARPLVYAAKLYTTGMADRVTNTTKKIHGAYGVSQETDIPRLCADAQVLGLFEGSPNIQKNMITRELM